MKIDSAMVALSRWCDNYALSFNERSGACLKRGIETGKNRQFYDWCSCSSPRFSIRLKLHALFLTNQEKICTRVFSRALLPLHSFTSNSDWSIYLSVSIVIIKGASSTMYLRQSIKNNFHMVNNHNF